MRKYIVQWASVGILVLIGWGVDVMPSNASWIPSFVIWGVAFIWLILTIIYYFKRRGKARVEPSKEKISKSENLADTLTAMHRRLVELQKHKSSHTKVKAKQLEDVIPTLADRMGTVEFKDWTKFKRDLKSRIRRAAPRRPTFKRPFRFIDFIKWREKVYLAALSVAKEVQDELFHSKEWTFEDGVKISEWLDGYDWGVKKLRDNDSKWMALHDSISHYRKDKVQRNLIERHIDFSYIYNNESLIVHYSGKFKRNEFSLMLHEALVGSPISPEKAEMALAEVLCDIDRRFEEMQKPKLFDIYCPTTKLGLPINKLDDGSYQASTASISPKPLQLMHRGELTTINRFTMTPRILFIQEDKGWETTTAITLSPSSNPLASSRTRDLSWDDSNPSQWVLGGLPLTLAKDESLTLPMLMISVRDGNEVGSRLDKGEMCTLTMSFGIFTDKGSPLLPDHQISLTRSDIKVRIFPIAESGAMK